MRLTTEQINTIVTTSRTVAGVDTLVWLYGSRLDDTRHGGDIDLLIEPAPAVSLLDRARIKILLEQQRPCAENPSSSPSPSRADNTRPDLHFPSVKYPQPILRR